MSDGPERPNQEGDTSGVELCPLVNDEHLELARLLFLERFIEMLASSLKLLHEETQRYDPTVSGGWTPHDMMRSMVDAAQWDSELASIEVAERLAERAAPFNSGMAEAFREYAQYARERYAGPGAEMVRGR